MCFEFKVFKRKEKEIHLYRVYYDAWLWDCVLKKRKCIATSKTLLWTHY